MAGSSKVRKRRGACCQQLFTPVIVPCTGTAFHPNKRNITGTKRESLSVTVEVKVTLGHATKTQMQVETYSFFNLGARGVGA